MSHVEDSNEDQQECNQQSKTAAAAVEARQRRRIAQLEQQLETLESGRAVKERQSNYYMSQGRAIRRIVTLFDNVEDLVAENDRRYDHDDDGDQENYSRVSFHRSNRLQIGYHALTIALPWFCQKGTEMEIGDYVHLLKILRQGADSARGDDTSKLKALVADWVNREFKPNPPVDSDDKHSRGFTNDVCGMLLCPAELDWKNPVVKAAIRDRAEGHIVTDLSFPAYLYEGYTANPDDLEEGLFKGKLLIQGYKAVFTSPSSAKDVEGDGDGIDIIENNRCARRSSSGLKVKKHVRFALSSVTSWRSVDGDFDYIQFWRTIVDFFEKPPGRGARRRINKLLEWWTRKVFGRSHRDDISNATKSNMSVNALAQQRAQRDDADFD
ncbi:hypothetical protein DEU56DRAFT_731599 [Suillus clintonianus]|uniref:uncharacterized protein n=1 Tax=Suillus clintonianus TaxID=1904413 RepID=UPI001B85E989|nr:uncharacterized protein DEU56DRAFT_731599 [Suillus clintonianus]KAG2146226.1 hypothetical protein DEU56DRAFT_731599 [Suillus clintonianus]